MLANYLVSFGYTYSQAVMERAIAALVTQYTLAHTFASQLVEHGLCRRRISFLHALRTTRPIFDKGSCNLMRAIPEFRSSNAAQTQTRGEGCAPRHLSPTQFLESLSYTILSGPHCIYSGTARNTRHIRLSLLGILFRFHEPYRYSYHRQAIALIYCNAVLQIRTNA
jgi:hypothetical protein